MAVAAPTAGVEAFSCICGVIVDIAAVVFEPWQDALVDGVGVGIVDPVISLADVDFVDPLHCGEADCCVAVAYDGRSDKIGCGSGCGKGGGKGQNFERFRFSLL